MVHSPLRFLRHLAALIQGSNLLYWRLMLSGRAGAARNLLATQLRQFLVAKNREPIPARSIFEVFPEAAEVAAQVQLEPSEIISCSIEELFYLAVITRCVRPQRIFEFGTSGGCTSLNFARNAPDDAVVFTLDLRSHETRKQFLEHAAGHKITELRGNSLEFDFSPYFNKMDLVFVHTAPAHRSVKSDSENAFKMLAPGGVILWHDYMSFGETHDVTRYLFDIAGSRSISQLASTTLAVFRCARKRKSESWDEVIDELSQQVATASPDEPALAGV